MKKSSLIAATSLGLVGVLALSGCGKDKNDEYVVSMKGGGVTQEQYYNKIKTQQQNEQVLQQMVLAKVAEEQVGDKVSDEDVNKQYDKFVKQAEKQAGGKEAFEQQLKAMGQSESTLKNSLKDQLLYQELLKSNVDVTDADMKKAFKTYHPEVEAQIIQVSEKSKADKLDKEAKQDPKKFGELAKKNSAHDSKSDEGKVTFDSTSTTIPAAVQKEAWKLKDGQVSGVIKAEEQDPSTLQTVSSYYIVKMNKQQDKGNDYKKYEKELKEIVTNQEIQNPEFVQKTIKKAFNDANVKVDDKDLANVFAQFTDASSSSSSSKEDK